MKGLTEEQVIAISEPFEQGWFDFGRDGTIQFGRACGDHAVEWLIEQGWISQNYAAECRKAWRAAQD